MEDRTDTDVGTSAQWEIISSHDWESHAAIETALCDVLCALDTDTEATVLYDHVDVEAVVDAISPGADRGVSEVRFECEEYEIRVDRTGTISAR